MFLFYQNSRVRHSGRFAKRFSSLAAKIKSYKKFVAQFSFSKILRSLLFLAAVRFFKVNRRGYVKPVLISKLTVRLARASPPSEKSEHRSVEAEKKRFRTDRRERRDATIGRAAN